LFVELGLEVNQAAELAKRTHVKMLLLNHISARYTGKMALELQSQARDSGTPESGT